MKRAFLVFSVLLLINLGIFVFRNSGFDYQEYATSGELCPPGLAIDNTRKWVRPNDIFLQSELEEGRQLLEKEINIRRITRTDSLATAIAGWLYSQFSTHTSKRPEPFMNLLTPLQQYYAVLENRSEVWCGIYQYVYGFFCTAAGLPCRYIELSPKEPGLSPHVLNEVFLAEHQGWAMVDVTRNKLLIMDGANNPLCAAEYYEKIVQQRAGPVIIVSAASADTIQSPGYKDPYFTTDYSLLYFYETNVDKVYLFTRKLERYFLPRPWYARHTDQPLPSNWLFHIKQFFALLLLLSVLFLLYLYLKQARDRG